MTTTTAARKLGATQSVGLFAIFTLILWLIIVWWNWGAIGRMNLEAGDFAANSLQVLQAQSGVLLDGHYSRFGFLHPGPSLLYLLTGFELALASGSGILPSAFSAHLAAAAFLASVSIITVAFTVRALSGRWLVAAASAASFVAVLAWQNTQTLTSPWMPYMVVLPFGAFLMTTALAATGRALALPAVAFFTGILIHGHASFFLITFAILAVALAYNTVTERPGSPGRILGRSFWGSNQRAAVATVVIGAVFLAPMAIRTMLAWPGPVYEYLTVGDSGTGRGFAGSFQALTSNPRGSWILAATLITLLVLAVLGRTLRRRTSAFPVIMILLTGIGAHLLYVVVSVDDPANSHLLLYFLSVPALVPTAVFLTIEGWSQRASLWLTITTLTMVLALVALVTYRPSVWPRDYLRSEIIPLDQQFPSANGPIVVDLDNTGNWGDVWSGALGWVLLRQREDPDTRVCIRENWFIGFTEKLQCTPADVEPGRVYRISDSDGGLKVANTGS